MIPTPNEPARGADILPWAIQATRALRALRPMSGPGIRLTETPGGVIIVGDPASSPGTTTITATPIHPWQVLDATQTDPVTGVKTPYLGVYLYSTVTGMTNPLNQSLWDGKTDKSGDVDGLLAVPAIGGKILLELEMDVDMVIQSAKLVSDTDGTLPEIETATTVLEVFGLQAEVTYCSKQRLEIASIVTPDPLLGGLTLTIGEDSRMVYQRWKLNITFIVNLVNGYPTFTPSFTL